jgi:hypothetical protein
LQGWKWTDFIHHEDVEGIVAKFRASLASGEPLLHGARVLRADGEYRWMLHHRVAVRDGCGQIVKWYGSSIDIEERKRAEDGQGAFLCIFAICIVASIPAVSRLFKRAGFLTILVRANEVSTGWPAPLNCIAVNQTPQGVPIAVNKRAGEDFLGAMLNPKFFIYLFINQL